MLVESMNPDVNSKPMARDAAEESVMAILAEVFDPEIPVLNVVEMGIVRRISFENGTVQVAIAPTYSGCPAMRMIELNIASALEQAGFVEPTIRTVYSEAWSTDLMSEAAKTKLEEYGIAPPPKTTDPEADLDGSRGRRVTCPFCKSSDTAIKSFFGSTACKSLHYCNGCDQPFEAFKCI